LNQAVENQKETDKELVSQLTQKNQALTEELLKIERKAVKHELTIFYQEIGIDDDFIKEKFEGDADWKEGYGANFDYEDIIDQKMTLDNRTDMKGAFKIVACICATERVKQLNEEFKNEEPKPERLGQALEEVAEG